MKRISAMVAAASVLVLIAADDPPKPKDAQASYEPRSAAGAGQKFLEKFVGEWDVQKAFYPRSGEPSRGKGRCRQAMIHGGRFLQSDFVFEQPGGESTGTGLIGFEPESGLFTSVWTDSRQTKMSLRRSRDKFDGEKIVLYSKSLDEAKESRSSKTISQIEDGGAKIVHKQYAIGAGGEERLMMELILTRKTPASGAK